MPSQKPGSSELFLSSLSAGDLRISRICLGTMTFGNPVSSHDVESLVHHAIDLGVNFYDTADSYEGYDRVAGSAGGVSEQILGRALRGRRKRVVITTKVGNDVGGSGLGRDHVSKQIDESLRRLETGYVDVYEMHRPDPTTPLSESIVAMTGLIAAGKIRYWGLSNYSAPQVAQILKLCDEGGWTRPIVIQPPYSWLNRDVEADLLPLCSEPGSP